MGSLPQAKLVQGPTDRARAERRLGYMLVAPAVIVMLLVTVYPIAYAAWLSIHRTDLRFPDKQGIVWFDNYSNVLHSSVWWNDVKASLIITVFSVIIELVLGTILALLMHRAVFGRGPVRATVLIPYGIVTVVAAFAWKYAFTPGQGWVNNIFHFHTPLLTQKNGSFVVIILTEVWKTTPFMALLILAGLALVPDELYRAAKIDGASTWQRFWKITFPLILPSLVVATLFRTLDAFRVFDTVFIQTSGQNGTESVSILGYNQLINRLNLGLGSAVSVLIFLCVLIIAAGFVAMLNFANARTGSGRR
jgi:multiple sugar transport system permease protein